MGVIVSLKVTWRHRVHVHVPDGMILRDEMVKGAVRVGGVRIRLVKGRQLDWQRVLLLKEREREIETTLCVTIMGNK